MKTWEEHRSAGSANARRAVQEHWAAGRADAAIREAWTAYCASPEDSETKILFAALVGEFPAQIGPEMRADLLLLLRDRDIAPDYLSTAGWSLLMREPWWNAALGEAACESMASRLEGDALALALLAETPVFSRDAEDVLTRLRRHLLLSGRWPDYPHLVEALIRQTALNGGAWPFGAAERERWAPPMTVAYLPPARTPVPHADFADPVTRAVAEDYERWPYPLWKRIMAEAPQKLAERIRALDPGGPDIVPANPKILIAGCGTGSEAAQTALAYPDAAITAIDLSQTSLDYARRQCASLGLDRIRFQHLDLHRIATLGERFDAIFCSGVPHHLPDPERGWAALAGVLRAGGVMRIMLYSRAARLWVAEARTLVQDLAAGPVDDDVLREVRRRFLERSGDPRAVPVLHASAFATLSGVHDLLLHRREDAFDVPRIARALEALRLRLLSFVIAAPDASVRYDVMFPQDRMHRDFRAIHFFEKREPMAFLSQYDFWCRSDAFWLR